MAKEIGIVLGGGGARGWAHIGVLLELKSIGIRPKVVAGCSMGSIVGAAYCAGRLNLLAHWSRRLTRLRMVRFFQLSSKLNGLVSETNLRELLHRKACPRELNFHDLPVRFGAVATDMFTGEEVPLTTGNVLDGVWSSIALPGIIAPIWREPRWLIDGGVVNPVPVGLARNLGADKVIAVDINTHLLAHRAATLRPNSTVPEEEPAMALMPEANIKDQNDDSLIGYATQRVWELSQSFFQEGRARSDTPSMMDAYNSYLYIMQDRITQLNYQNHPADILVSPEVGHMGLMDFHLAEEAIALGRQAIHDRQEEILDLVNS